MNPSHLRTVRNASDVRAGKRDWFRFENKAGPEAIIDLYDEISFFGVTAADFLAELNQVTSPSIALNINSPGGDVFDGIAIFNALKSHRATVNVNVVSIAASIASVIAMAGDTITMAQGSMMMIHEPFALVIGDARDMRKQAEALDLMGDSIAGIYASRAGGTQAEWRARMAEESWYGDVGAVDIGLADAVTGVAAAKNVFDLSIFRNAPKEYPVRTGQPKSVFDWRTRARLDLEAAALGR